MEVETLSSNLIFVLRHFLTPEECARFITLTEEKGYDDAPITTSSGFVMRKDIRNNDRVMIDDEELAQQLYARAEPYLVKHWLTRWELVGFNERFRYYRYDPGQRFAMHTDGCYQRDNGDRSHFTFMIYLNDDFEGGTTDFPNHTPPISVRPETGSALVFAHKLLHEGTSVTRGRKYVLRTDIMYRQQ